MSVTLVSKSTILPMQLAEAKRHLVVDSTDHDLFIKDLLLAAQEYAERKVFGGRTIMASTYQLTLRRFPPGSEPLEFPYPPLVKLSTAATITYFDGSNTSTTMSSTKVYVQTPRMTHGSIEPLYNTTWPLTVDRPDAVTINFVAGYTAAANIPETIKQMIRLIIGDWFENRGEDTQVRIGQSMSRHVDVAVERLAQANSAGFYR